MLSISLRRSSSSVASVYPLRQTLAVLVSLDSSLLSPLKSTNSSPFGCCGESNGVLGGVGCRKVRSCGVPWSREFHVGAGPLRFRASGVARAQLALDECYEEESVIGGADKGDENLEIARLGVSRDIVEKLAARGITKLFPIQKAVLEPAMQGRDMIGRAKTGTGKTLAFGIPIMDNIIRRQATNRRSRNPLAVVLAPTRELARQVEKEFRESSSLQTLCVYGGTPIGQQARALNYGVDVVVGTPGRMIDLMDRGALILSEVQYIVLDEADQMLAVGFAEAVEKILEKLPQNRQSMMFSATMPDSIRTLTRRYLNNPLLVDLIGDSDQKLAEGISLYSIAVDRHSRQSILGPLVKEHAKGGKSIIFTQTKRDADQLSYSLSQSLGCQALHGDISQYQRERTLAGFRDGQFNTLIATDVAARGLDIPNVDLVIHYELPNTSELFVHRSGRTGRAGKTGTAILIYTYEQQRAVRDIERDVGCKFIELPKITVEGGEMPAGRFDSYGGGRSYGNAGNYGGSSFGRSSRFGASGGFGTYNRNNEPGTGHSGSFGGRSSGSSGFGRPSEFGSTDRGRFGNFENTSSGPLGSTSGYSSNFGWSGDSRSGHVSAGSQKDNWS